MSKYQKQWLAAGRCFTCGGERDESTLQSCGKCRPKLSATAKKQNQRYRKQVLEHYGGTCICCGDTTPEFLCLDHINNDGALRRKLDPTERNLTLWVIKHKYPPDFQLLCYNCNMVKRRGGTCPHAEGSMPRIFTISIPQADEWILPVLEKLKGSRSAHVVQAIKDYLESCGEGPDGGNGTKPPYWYVKGKDYSHLEIEMRRKLVPFGYMDDGVKDETEQKQ